MNTAQEINFGVIVSSTLKVIQDNAVPVALFMGGLVALGVLADMNGSGLQIVVSIASIIATYLLVETFMKQSGQLSENATRRFLPYVGLSILTGLGTGLALLLLIIPGLIVAARWSLAGPLLIGRGELVMEAMSKSWDMTKPYVLPIIGAGLLIAAVFIGLIILSAVVLEETSLFALITAGIGANGVSVATAALGVALLGLIDPGRDELTDVFS